jgi:glycosyltransferase involved in cell wall biosynthesis
MRGHTNTFEVVAIAESFLELGYRVEICDHNDQYYDLPSDCVVAIDIHSNLERWHSNFNGKCHFILHATGTHWLQWNLSEMKRLDYVKNRRGVALSPRRQVPASRAIEIADEVCVLGNEYTMHSFDFARKKITRIPISSAYEFPWPVDRDFAMAKRKFLWVGSFGMVHKGLDLVLDAFASMPELELTVCGRPEKEGDFFRLYEDLLRNRSNIHLHGWIDMSHPDFLEIARTHATVIYPSSAEGGAGSVIHCMHAGMIPACTYEASIDLVNFGELVQFGTVEAVQAACRRIASLPDSQVESRARAAYDHARTIHTRERFRENYRNYAASVIARIK